MSEPGQRENIVLVHGAWHSAWHWHRLVPELERRGWSTSAVELPSTGGDPEKGMYDDARALREHLESVDGPVTVLAHSYAGLPVSEVADTVPNVRHLLYLAAHMLEAGEADVTPLGGPWFPADSRLIPVPDSARDALFHDVPGELADEAIARLRPQSARSFTDEQTHTAWRTLPSALIICDEDRIIPEVFIKRALTSKMADVVRHLPGSHSPFLSRPAELADLVDEVTTALDA